MARHAGIGAGTLFNYAATKGELLLLVMNDRLRRRVDEVVAARDDADPDLWLALVKAVEPLDELSRDTPELTALYLREVVFGLDGPNRQDALDLVAHLRALLTGLLSRRASSLRHADQVEAAADLLFGITVHELMGRASASRATGSSEKAADETTVRGTTPDASRWPSQYRLALDGLLAQHSEKAHECRPRLPDSSA